MDDCPHGHEKRTCEICELTTERDRLRNDLHRERGVKQVKDVALLDVLAERDRLRAVVDAARAWRRDLEIHRQASMTDNPDFWFDELEASELNLKAALDQLDESAEVTDG